MEVAAVERYPAAPVVPLPAGLAVPVARIANRDAWQGSGSLDDLFATRFFWSSDCGRLRFAALGETRRVSYQNLGVAVQSAAEELELPGIMAAQLPLGVFALGQTDHRPGAFECGETETSVRCWIPRVLLLQDGDSHLVFCADDRLRNEVVERLGRREDATGVNGSWPAWQGCRPGLLENPVDDQRTWEQRVDAALAGIESGCLEKLVVSRRLEFAPAAAPFSPRASSWHVGRAAGRTGFSISTDAGRSMFIGATPETLVQVRNGKLTTHALAGTFRGSASLEDFRASGKLTQEHAYVVDGMVRDLGPFVRGIRPGAVRVRRAGLVTHLEAPLAADLHDGINPLDILSALHPTPAIGGLPRHAALDALATIEPYSRGWFAAPVGWMAANGDLHAAIAIRSLWIAPERAVALAGAGIVRGSIATKEWTETEDKFDNMRAAIRGQIVAE